MALTAGQIHSFWIIGSNAWACKYGKFVSKKIKGFKDSELEEKYRMIFLMLETIKGFDNTEVAFGTGTGITSSQNLSWNNPNCDLIVGKTMWEGTINGLNLGISVDISNIAVGTASLKNITTGMFKHLWKLQRCLGSLLTLFKHFWKF
jgi:hypothetical protein